MDREKFIEYVKVLQLIERKQMQLVGSGVDLIDYNENFFVAMDYLMKALFLPYEIDLVNDLVWLKKDITIYETKTKKVLFVINSPETLWEYMEDAKKK